MATNLMAEFSAAKKGDVLNFEYLSPKVGWSKLCPILDRCNQPNFRPIELGELNFEPTSKLHFHPKTKT